MKTLKTIWATACVWYATVFNFLTDYVVNGKYSPLLPIYSFLFGTHCELCSAVRLAIFVGALVAGWWPLAVFVLLLRVMDKLMLTFPPEGEASISVAPDATTSDVSSKPLTSKVPVAPSVELQLEANSKAAKAAAIKAKILAKK